MTPARLCGCATRACLAGHLATLALLAACARGDAPRTADSAVAVCGGAPAAGARTRTIVVSENARGMVTAVRWARSPDGCALLVVEDPVGVEAEPIPDVVRYVASTPAGPRVIEIDSVWDAAPDARWTRLAVGRAYVARAGESDTLPDAAWGALARAAGRPERDVRDASFAASGMTVARAVARPTVYSLAPSPDSVPRALPLLGGWRIRWAPGDSALLVGSGPARVGDDEPPRGWLPVDARTGRPLGGWTSPPAVAPAADWQEAPLLDVSTAVDLPAAARTPLGPGVALAATADGRVVLALAPRAQPVREGELAWRVVLYVVE